MKLDPIYSVLLSALEEGTKDWQEELGEVGEDLIVWQPYPQGYSIGALLLHIAEVETFWIESFGLGRELDSDEMALYLSEEIQQFSGVWPVPPRAPLDYYLGLLANVRGRTLESVRLLDSPETEKELEPGTSMSLQSALAHVIHHESYHGGQAVMLKEMSKRRLS